MDAGRGREVRPVAVDVRADPARDGTRVASPADLGGGRRVARPVPAHGRRGRASVSRTQHNVRPRWGRHRPAVWWPSRRPSGVFSCVLSHAEPGQASVTGSGTADKSSRSHRDGHPHSRTGTPRRSRPMRPTRSQLAICHCWRAPMLERMAAMEGRRRRSRSGGTRHGLRKLRAGKAGTR